MNKIIDKKQGIILDPLMVLKNLEYLKDHLVIEDLVKQSVQVEEDLDSTILICTSDYDE